MSGATHSFNFVREMLCLKVVEILEEKSEKILLENGLEIVDIEFKKEGKNKILRYYLERLEGRVSLDELGSANKILSDLLDELDLIDEEYILEVSSPGVNRVIKKEKDLLNDELQKIINSKSWKITQPIRNLRMNSKRK